MKLSYDIIKSNIEIYQQAKDTIPTISQYERGELSQSAMSSLNLSKFADFFNFMSSVKKDGFEIIIPDMNWRKLKPILIEKTTNEKFKKFISNRTQNQFQSLLKDAETYDRLLNGRWLRKPKPTRRGRISSGSRSEDYASGLVSGIIPMINYIIQNDVEVFLSAKSGYFDIKSFVSQDKYNQYLKWFTNEKLSLSSAPVREIEVTNKLISSFVEILENSKITIDNETIKVISKDGNILNVIRGYYNTDSSNHVLGSAIKLITNQDNTLINLEDDFGFNGEIS